MDWLSAVFELVNVMEPLIGMETVALPAPHSGARYCTIGVAVAIGIGIGFWGTSLKPHSSVFPKKSSIPIPIATATPMV